MQLNYHLCIWRTCDGSCSPQTACFFPCETDQPVYQSLMHCHSFTMTRHVPSCFFGVLEPCLCRGFLQRCALPYKICFCLNDFMLALVIFQREFLWRCSKCCQRWISLLKGAPVAISFCNKKDEEVELSSARGEHKITHSHSVLIIFSLEASQCELWCVSAWGEERGWNLWGVKE